MPPAPPSSAAREAGRLRVAVSEARAIPLAGARAAAGFPSPADDFLETSLDLHDLMVANPPATFFLRVAGDSMTGAGIASGDLLVVDRSIEPRDGSVVVAAVDGELVVKRLARRPDRTALESARPGYPPIEIREGVEAAIWGVVTYAVRKMER